MSKDEDLIKWIEDEVYKHGTISFTREEKYVDIDGSRVFKAYPTGEFGGFSVSSQHVRNSLNIKQLIMNMMDKQKEREHDARR